MAKFPSISQWPLNYTFTDPSCRSLNRNKGIMSSLFIQKIRSVSQSKKIILNLLNITLSKMPQNRRKTEIRSERRQTGHKYSADAILSKNAKICREASPSTWDRRCSPSWRSRSDTGWPVWRSAASWASRSSCPPSVTSWRTSASWSCRRASWRGGGWASNPGRGRERPRKTVETWKDL